MKLIKIRGLEAKKPKRANSAMRTGRMYRCLMSRYREHHRYDELDFTAGVSDEQISERLTKGLELLKKQKALKGLPISKFDVKTGKAYLEFPDGRVEYVD